jgi:hypothetical protein
MVQLYEKLKTGVWGHLEKGVKLTQMSWKLRSHKNLHVDLITITKTWEQPRCPSVDEWLNWSIQTMEYYSVKWIIKINNKKKW